MITCFSFFKFLLPGSTWILELNHASLLDWMLIGRHGYSFYSHSTSGPLLVSSLLLAATPLASLTSLVADLFLFSHTFPFVLHEAPSYDNRCYLSSSNNAISQNTSYVVWYLNGNLRYCQHPHIYLFMAAMATLVFLWLPYTLLLL